MKTLIKMAIISLLILWCGYSDAQEHKTLSSLAMINGILDVGQIDKYKVSSMIIASFGKAHASMALHSLFAIIQGCRKNSILQ